MAMKTRLTTTQFSSAPTGRILPTVGCAEWHPCLGFEQNATLVIDDLSHLPQSYWSAQHSEQNVPAHCLSSG